MPFAKFAGEKLKWLRFKSAVYRSAGVPAPLHWWERDGKLIALETIPEKVGRVSGKERALAAWLGDLPKEATVGRITAAGFSLQFPRPDEEFSSIFFGAEEALTRLPRHHTWRNGKRGESEQALGFADFVIQTDPSLLPTDWKATLTQRGLTLRAELLRRFQPRPNGRLIPEQEFRALSNYAGSAHEGVNWFLRNLGYFGRTSSEGLSSSTKARPPLE
ncbi:MAG: hypothetical protein AAB425_09210 [Bdellovibrionota bacterium]